MNLELLQILLNIILIISALYLVCIFAFTYGLYNLKERFFTFNKKNDLKVSILIAARNEENNIERLLKSLYNQTFEKDLFEVIIIDDHSKDNTLLIYPNPAKDYINIIGENNLTIDIYNSLGQKIYSEESENSTTIKTSDWTPGIYFVKINNQVYKVIK